MKAICIAALVLLVVGAYSAPFGLGLKIAEPMKGNQNWVWKNGILVDTAKPAVMPKITPKLAEESGNAMDIFKQIIEIGKVVAPIAIDAGKKLAPVVINAINNRRLAEESGAMDVLGKIFEIGKIVAPIAIDAGKKIAPVVINAINNRRLAEESGNGMDILKKIIEVGKVVAPIAIDAGKKLAPVVIDLINKKRLAEESILLDDQFFQNRPGVMPNRPVVKPNWPSIMPINQPRLSVILPAVMPNPRIKVAEESGNAMDIFKQILEVGKVVAPIAIDAGKKLAPVVIDLINKKKL